MKLADREKNQYQGEIVADIYGRRRGDTMEKGLAEADDEDDFTAKLLSCQPRWEKLCSGFYDWFVTHRKRDFIASVIKSAREGTNVSGIYYQNDIESKHAVQKRIQYFQGKTLTDALETIKALIEREESDEIMALYGNGNYVLSSAYKSWFMPRWHSLSPEEKRRYFERFCSAKPSIESTFSKPANSGRKANHRVRSRSDAAPTILIDRVTPATTPTLVTSSQPVMPMESLGPADLSISFQDPRVDPEPVFELYLKKNLPSSVKTCQGKCNADITNEPKHKLVVKSVGSRPYWKNGKEMTSHGPLYIHFHGSCLKRYDRNRYYAPQEQFDWTRIHVHETTYKDLTDPKEVAFVMNMGVPWNPPRQ